MSDRPLSDADVSKLVRLDEAIGSGAPTPNRSSGPNAETVDLDRAEFNDVLLQLEQRWPRQSRDSAALPLTVTPEIAGYRIERELGRGGFGVVFLARDASEKYIALKVPRPEMLLSEDVRKRFLTEAAAIASLSHPGIVPVHEVGDEGPVCFLASAYVPGPSLAQALSGGQLRCTPRQAAALVKQLAAAVEHVHERGLLHRDLKPSNVLLWPREAPPVGEEQIAWQPMLADFGLAKFVELSFKDTQSSILLGTPLYMAPEQAECRADDVGPWTDVYSLGVILYELLTGQPPFAGEGLLYVLNRVRTEAPLPPQMLNSETPAPLSRICLKCLAKEPADRYASAKELEEELARFLSGGRVRAKPMSLARKLSLWSRRPERMRDAGLVTLALNVGLILWMVGMGVGVHMVPDWKRAATADFRLQVSLVVLLLHCPQLLLGWQTLRGRWWAILGGTVFAAVQLAMAVGAIVQGEPPFEAMYPDALAMFNSFWLLTQLFTAELLLYLLAIRAGLNLKAR